jgi:hypothetical protein
MNIHVAKHYRYRTAKNMSTYLVPCTGRGLVHTGFWLGNLREGDHLEDPGVDGRRILKWILKKWDGGAWTGLIWVRRGTEVAGSCKCGNEPSGSIKCREFLD